MHIGTVADFFLFFAELCDYEDENILSINDFIIQVYSIILFLSKYVIMMFTFVRLVLLRGLIHESLLTVTYWQATLNIV